MGHFDSAEDMAQRHGDELLRKERAESELRSMCKEYYLRMWGMGCPVDRWGTYDMGGVWRSDSEGGLWRYSRWGDPDSGVLPRPDESGRYAALGKPLHYDAEAVLAMLKEHASEQLEYLARHLTLRDGRGLGR